MNSNIRIIYGDIIVNQANIPIGIFSVPRCIESFHGREKEMKNLDSLFFQKKKNKVVICGLPGFGKTELAKQYAKRCLETKQVDKSFFMPFENLENVHELYSHLRRIYREYQKKRCLFVFDNCLDRRSIFDYEPPDIDNYFLLITSHEMDFIEDVATLQIQPLSTDAAIEIFKSILYKNYEPENRALYEELSNIIGNVPLGIQIVGGCLREHMKVMGKCFNLKEYVNSIQENILVQTIPESIANTYNKSVYAAIKLMLTKIEEFCYDDATLYDLILNLLYICSYLNPDIIYFEELFLIPNISCMLKNNTVNYIKKSLYVLINFTIVNQEQNSKEKIICIQSIIQSFFRYELSSHKQNSQTQAYMSSLEYVFGEINGINHHIDHTKSVLNYADENVTTVFEFFNNHIKNEKISKNILENLIKYGCVECIKKIVKNLNEIINEHNLLHLAAKYDQIEILRVLLTNVDIDKTDEQNETILHIAARDWKLEQIQILLEFKPNTNIKNNEGNVPLFEFVNRPYFNSNINWNDVLQMFKFKKDITNNKKQTLLHIAAVNYNDVLVKLLIDEYKLSVNQKDAHYMTPLDVLNNTISKSVSTFNNINKINRGMTIVKLLSS